MQYVTQILHDAKLRLAEAQDEGNMEAAEALDTLLSALPANIVGVIVHPQARSGSAPQDTNGSRLVEPTNGMHTTEGNESDKTLAVKIDAPHEVGMIAVCKFIFEKFWKKGPHLPNIQKNTDFFFNSIFSLCSRRLQCRSLIWLTSLS